MDNNRTSEGLRDRLFTALDLFIDKKVTSKEIEGICYLSEQIIKTANVELEFQKEINEEKRNERDHTLKIKKEEITAAELLQITLKKVEENV
jgi:hypothetical protein